MGGVKSLSTLVGYNTRKIAIAIIAIILVLQVALATIGFVALAQQQVPRDQTVIVSSSWAVPSGFNPLIPGVSAWGSNFLMYPYLFIYGPYTDDFVSYLAQSFDFLDPYTLKITLRSGAYWWDGEPITADDVVFTFNLGRLCTTTGSYIWNYITDVKALDPLNVVFYINKSNVNYYRVVDILTWMILPKHRWENLYNQMGCKIATDFQDTVPSEIVGGGPYRLLYWSGDTWVYERVDNWWGAKYFGLPAPKYVMHIVPKSDEQVRLEWI